MYEQEPFHVFINETRKSNDHLKEISSDNCTTACIFEFTVDNDFQKCVAHQKIHRCCQICVKQKHGTFQCNLTKRTFTHEEFLYLPETNEQNLNFAQAPKRKQIQRLDTDGKKTAKIASLDTLLSCVGLSKDKTPGFYEFAIHVYKFYIDYIRETVQKQRNSVTKQKKNKSKTHTVPNANFFLSALLLNVELQKTFTDGSDLRIFQFENLDSAHAKTLNKKNPVFHTKKNIIRTDTINTLNNLFSKTESLRQLLPKL